MELLRNADLYDPEPRGRAHILVAGETIAWMGTETPADLRTLGVHERDLEGRRVIPGLIDSHVHVMARGRWHVVSGTPVVRGTFERRE